MLASCFGGRSVLCMKIDSRIDQMGCMYRTQLSVCPLLQEPTPTAVAAPAGISPKFKQARTNKEDEALLMPFESMTSAQQRLSESSLLCRLADTNRDCIVQVLQIGGFMKYLVLSVVLHAQAESCVIDGNICTPLFESILTMSHELSAGNVSVLAVDMHILQDCQIAHTICYCGELNL